MKTSTEKTSTPNGHVSIVETTTDDDGKIVGMTTRTFTPAQFAAHCRDADYAQSLGVALSAATVKGE